MDLIDIHCHILPGVDDGSKSMEESLAMLRIAQQNAIRTIIVTPHNKPGRHNIHIPSMNVYIKQLQEQMGRAGLSIELIGGNELYYRMELAQELHGGVARTMADSRSATCRSVQQSPSPPSNTSSLFSRFRALAIPAARKSTVSRNTRSTSPLPVIRQKSA